MQLNDLIRLGIPVVHSVASPMHRKATPTSEAVQSRNLKEPIVSVKFVSVQMRTRTLFGDWLALTNGMYRHLPTNTITESPPPIVERFAAREQLLLASYTAAGPRSLYMDTPHRFALPLTGRIEVEECVVEPRWANHKASQHSYVQVQAVVDEDDDIDEALVFTSSDADQGGVSVVHLLDVGEQGTAFVLRNLLTSAECREVVAQCKEFGLESINDAGYSKRIRINDRVAVVSEGLAESLFERSLPFLSDILIPDPNDLDVINPWPEGIPEGATPGLWLVDHLNPCFRVCRYRPGGFFATHFDGGHAVDQGLMSFKTFMLYLNTIDESAGGPTTFYTKAQKKYRKLTDPSCVTYRFQPEAAACLVFSSEILHDGGELQHGAKWILRTEVMYRYAGKAVHGAEVKRPKSSREMAELKAQREQERKG